MIKELYYFDPSKTFGQDPPPSVNDSSESFRKFNCGQLGDVSHDMWSIDRLSHVPVIRP